MGVDSEPSDQVQATKGTFMMQTLNLLILIFSIIHTGFAKPGKHFLIETDDAAEEEDGAGDSKDYGPDKDRCEPNKEWKEKGCLTCTCLNDGKASSCLTCAIPYRCHEEECVID